MGSEKSHISTFLEAPSERVCPESSISLKDPAPSYPTIHALHLVRVGACHRHPDAGMGVVGAAGASVDEGSGGAGRGRAVLVLTPRGVVYIGYVLVVTGGWGRLYTVRERMAKNAQIYSLMPFSDI